jgi:DNA repair exonuclease SbcCD ATPase subunit
MNFASRLIVIPLSAMVFALSACANQSDTNMLEGCGAGTLTGMGGAALTDLLNTGTVSTKSLVIGGGVGCAAGTAVAIYVNGRQQRYASLDQALTAQIAAANQAAEDANQATADAQTNIDGINARMAALRYKAYSFHRRHEALLTSYQQLTTEQQSLTAEQSKLTDAIAEQQKNYASISNGHTLTAAQQAQMAQWQSDIAAMQNAVDEIADKQSQTSKLMANIRAADNTVN